MKINILKVTYPLRPEPGLGSSRRGAVLYVCLLYIKIKYEINAARVLQLLVARGRLSWVQAGLAMNRIFEVL